MFITWDFVMDMTAVKQPLYQTDVLFGTHSLTHTHTEMEAQSCKHTHTQTEAGDNRAILHERSWIIQNPWSQTDSWVDRIIWQILLLLWDEKDHRCFRDSNTQYNIKIFQKIQNTLWMYTCLQIYIFCTSYSVCFTCSDLISFWLEHKAD